MKTNYVLIDYENVQPKYMTLLNQEHYHVLVFLGATQTKIACDVAIPLQTMGPRARYIQMARTGANALDFHIAFYVGQLSSADPHAYFHIISKDTGFDPLIQHLREQKIGITRSPDIPNMPAIKELTATTLLEQIEVIRTNFAQRGTSRPRTVKTLRSTINALFQKRLPENDLTNLIKELERQHIITLTDTKVSYGQT